MCVCMWYKVARFVAMTPVTRSHTTRPSCLQIAWFCMLRCAGVQLRFLMFDLFDFCMLRCAVVVLSFVTDTPCVYQISHEKSRFEFVAKVAFADIGEIISEVVLMAFVFFCELGP